MFYDDCFTPQKHARMLQLQAYQAERFGLTPQEAQELKELESDLGMVEFSDDILLFGN
jgi:DNA-binding CsgD family transcriptional regulator